jgi:hypothetical protein
MHAHRKHHAASLCTLMLLLGLATMAVAQGPRTGAIVVNGEPLSPATIQALEAQYRVPLQAGRYWYDRLTGAWGLEGGPTVAQIHPGLALGGPLRADASGGQTGVFVNGRALHPADVAALQRCTAVMPGRYWMNAAGIGGFEGGPPFFNLALLCQRATGGTGTGAGGRVLQGGGITSYTPPAGIPGGIGVSCGPGGGCVYSK